MWRMMRVIALMAIAISGTVSNAQADVVLDWNELSAEILVNNQSYQNPGYASRSLAMMNLAIYDSFAVTSTLFRPDTFLDYDLQVTRYRRASGEVAAAQAAYTVLSSLYPDQQSLLDDALSASLNSHAESHDKSNGIALGTELGNAIVASRANDGYDTVGQYMPTYEVGRWQPDPVNPGQEAWGPAWGEVDTFALQSVDQHLPGPMPDLTSIEYADSYNEVKQLGSVDSTTRTPEQTEIGLFWAYDRAGMGTPHSMYNQVLRNIARQQGNTTTENAELFAKATVAMADAGIVAWNSKFEHDFWRPVTGIRDGDLDGNPLTEAEADWTPLGAPDGEDEVGFTPPFPTYISGHATFGGALFGSLQEFYGTDDIEFTLTSKELEVLLDNPELQQLYGLDLEDAQRSFTSLGEAMAENGRSRVYLGIHWDFDDLVGREVGQDIAEAIFANSFAAADHAPSTGHSSGGESEWSLDDLLDDADSRFGDGLSGLEPDQGWSAGDDLTDEQDQGPHLRHMPEPGTATLLALAMLTCAVRRRQ